MLKLLVKFADFKPLPLVTVTMVKKILLVLSTYQIEGFQ